MSCLLRQLSVDKSTELNENVGELINLTSWGRLDAFLPQILFYRSDQMYGKKSFMDRKFAITHKTLNIQSTQALAMKSL